MNIVADSTHLKNWIYTKERLNEERLRKTGRLKYIISKVINEEKCPLSQILIVNNQSELDVVRYYVASIRTICQNFSMSVFSTAAQYLIRFFTKKSIYSHNPIQILYACLNLAMKVEEFHVHPAEFISKCKKHCSKEDLIKSEMALLTLLKFNLRVISPYDSIESLIAIDRKGSTLMEQQCQEIRVKAYQFVDKAFLSDAFLLYSPNKIAYAGYSLVFPETSYKPNERILSDAGEIREMVSTSKLKDKARIKDILQNVKKFVCSHPKFLEAVGDEVTLKALKRKSENKETPKRMKLE